MSAKQCDIGLIGLAVMGENLVLNMESKGFSVAVFNRTVSVTIDNSRFAYFLDVSLPSSAQVALLNVRLTYTVTEAD